MTPSSSMFRAWILAGIAVLSSAAFAQRSSTSNNPNNTRPGGPSRTPTGPDLSNQPVFVSGKVMLEGGGSLTEPVAIERICNSVTRREGYTDFKGQFAFQLGVNTTFQDASENDTRLTPSPSTRIGNIQTRRPLDLTGCEFRAVLAGYHSSTAMVRTAGDTWQYDIGIIVLKRVGDAKGTTISVTSMAAPHDAIRAFEKAERMRQEKPAEAEKDLRKAVQIYPQFAAAWTLLGDMHRQSNQLELARTEYAQAISADPQFVNPQYGMTMIAVQEKKWDETIQFSNQVLKMNAMAYPLAYFFNAAANYNVQKYDDAEESARRFKALDPQHTHPDVFLLMSQLLTRKQDYAGAARELRDYLAVVPNAPEADAIRTDAKRLEDLGVSAKKD